jgi:hypothetical protein
MISIGGSQKNAQTDQEPWPNGLGIFDMTTLNWTNAYDAAAPAYERPGLVSQFYANNSRYPATWIDPVLRNIFAAPNETTNMPGGNSSSGNNGGSSNSGGGSNNINTGAIAGGVAGGVAALALIGALIYWRLRRHNGKGGQSQNQSVAEGSVPRFEAEARPEAIEIHTKINTAELATNANHHEVPGNNRAMALELPA